MSVIGDFDLESEPLNKGREGHSLPQLAYLDSITTYHLKAFTDPFCSTVLPLMLFDDLCWRRISSLTIVFENTFALASKEHTALISERHCIGFGLECGQ